MGFNSGLNLSARLYNLIRGLNSGLTLSVRLYNVIRGFNTGLNLSARLYNVISGLNSGLTLSVLLYKVISGGEGQLSWFFDFSAVRKYFGVFKVYIGETTDVLSFTERFRGRMNERSIGWIGTS